MSEVIGFTMIKDSERQTNGRRIAYEGAEAQLSLGVFEGKETIIKERIRKGYRAPQLDLRLRKERASQEARLLLAAKRAGVNVPLMFEGKDFMINMELINGERLKDLLETMRDEEMEDVWEKIGKGISRLHSSGIVHGDLTTANMIVKKEPLASTVDVYFVDFGLGFFTQKIEDRAMDLWLLYESLGALHPKHSKRGWESILYAYKKNYPDSVNIIRRIDDIKKRRRYAAGTQKGMAAKD